MMKLLRVSEVRNEILKYFISCCLTRFIPCWIRLSEANKVFNYNQDVLVALTLLQVEVNTEQLKWSTRGYFSHWSSLWHIRVVHLLVT